MGICRVNTENSGIRNIGCILLLLLLLPAGINPPTFSTRHGDATYGDAAAQAQGEVQDPDDAEPDSRLLEHIVYGYLLVLGSIATVLLVAQRIHGNLIASKEEQRIRDEWYRTDHDGPWIL